MVSASTQEAAAALTAVLGGPSASRSSAGGAAASRSLRGAQEQDLAAGITELQIAAQLEAGALPAPAPSSNVFVDLEFLGGWSGVKIAPQNEGEGLRLTQEGVEEVISASDLPSIGVRGRPKESELMQYYLRTEDDATPRWIEGSRLKGSLLSKVRQDVPEEEVTRVHQLRERQQALLRAGGDELDDEFFAFDPSSGQRVPVRRPHPTIPPHSSSLRFTHPQLDAGDDKIFAVVCSWCGKDYCLRGSGDQAGARLRKQLAGHTSGCDWKAPPLAGESGLPVRPSWKERAAAAWTTTPEKSWCAPHPFITLSHPPPDQQRLRQGVRRV